MSSSLSSTTVAASPSPLSSSDSPSSTLSPLLTSTQMSAADPPSSSTTAITTTSSSPTMPPPSSTSTRTSTSTSTTSISTSTTSTSTSETTEPPTTSTTSTPDPPPTSTSSQSPEPTTSDFPSTTSTPFTRRPTPTKTLPSIVFVSTTDNRGFPSSTAPPAITSTFTSTGTDGGLVTVTEVIANPTLIPNTARSKGNGFFGNTGAVAAVFVLVGLAAASIALWILFAVRRRRRQRQIERETAVAALQAAAAHRSPLDDDDDPHQPHMSASILEMSQRRSSSGLASNFMDPRLSYHDDPDHPDAFNPYSDFGYPPPGPLAPNASRDGYATARTNSPPVAYFNSTPYDRSRKASGGSLGSASGVMGNHSATHSGASYEPLLASYYRQNGGSGPQSSSPVLASPPAAAVSPHVTPAYSSPGHGQTPLLDDREPVEGQSVLTAETTDDRLDPGLRQRQKEAESASMKDLRDDEDYSRPVLGARNLP